MCCVGIACSSRTGKGSGISKTLYIEFHIIALMHDSIPQPRTIDFQEHHAILAILHPPTFSTEGEMSIVFVPDKSWQASSAIPALSNTSHWDEPELTIDWFVLFTRTR